MSGTHSKLTATLAEADQKRIEKQITKLNKEIHYLTTKIDSFANGASPDKDIYSMKELEKELAEDKIALAESKTELAQLQKLKQLNKEITLLQSEIQNLKKPVTPLNISGDWSNPNDTPETRHAEEIAAIPMMEAKLNELITERTQLSRLMVLNQEINALKSRIETLQEPVNSLNMGGDWSNPHDTPATRHAEDKANIPTMKAQLDELITERTQLSRLMKLTQEINKLESQIQTFQEKPANPLNMAGDWSNPKDTPATKHAKDQAGIPAMKANLKHLKTQQKQLSEVMELNKEINILKSRIERFPKPTNVLNAAGNWNDPTKTPGVELANDQAKLKELMAIRATYLVTPDSKSDKKDNHPVKPDAKPTGPEEGSLKNPTKTTAAAPPTPRKP